jgi:hypothetical protein
MSTAAARRLRRWAVTEQLSLEVPLATPGAPAPLDPDQAQAALAGLAADLSGDFTEPADDWDDSPYLWLKQLPPVSRGRAAAALLHRWCQHLGIPATANPKAPTELSTPAGTVQVKSSTLWSAGEYRFQAVRPGHHTHLALLGISPHRAHLWVLPSGLALAHRDNVRGDAGWITLTPTRPAAWTHPYGPEPATAAALLGRDS